VGPGEPVGLGPPVVPVGPVGLGEPVGLGPPVVPVGPVGPGEPVGLGGLSKVGLAVGEIVCVGDDVGVAVGATPGDTERGGSRTRVLGRIAVGEVAYSSNSASARPTRTTTASRTVIRRGSIFTGTPHLIETLSRLEEEKTHAKLALSERSPQ
jgi:hypothetical protein